MTDDEVVAAIHALVAAGEHLDCIRGVPGARLPGWVGMFAIAPGVCGRDRTTNLDTTGLWHKGCYQPLATQDLSSWRCINRDRP
jgi:hypothetical protein